MIHVMRGTDWCKWRDLRPSRGGSSPVMAARQSSSARCRRRRALAATSELGMSSTTSLRSCPSRERRTRRSRWWVAAVSSAPARPRHGGGFKKMANGPHLWHVWLSESDDEVRGVLAELWAGSCWLWCSGELARARQNKWRQRGPLRLLW